MEDAIDEWIIRQINWLRREDVIVQGIRWIQDVRRHIILFSPSLGLYCFSFDASVALLFFFLNTEETFVSYIKEIRRKWSL